MSALGEPFRGGRRGLLLTGLLLVVYFVFIGFVAFAPRLMARPTIGVVSLGLLAAIGVIVFAVLLTAVYVWLGNREERA